MKKITAYCLINIFYFSLFILFFYCGKGFCEAEKKISATSNLGPSSIKRSFLFPTRQVENNVAVEFFFKALPDDEKGFEDKLSRFVDQIANDQVETASVNTSQKFNDQDPKHVRTGEDVALIFKVTDATMNWPIQGQGYVPDSPIRNVRGPGNLKATCRQILKRAKLYGGHFPIDEYTYLYVLNTIDGSVSVVDTSSLQSGRPIEIIDLSNNDKSKAIDIDMAWLGRYAYATLENDEIAVIDCMRMKVIRRFKVGKNPHHVFVQPDGRFAWICNDGGATVTLIDTESQKIAKKIDVGHGHHEIAFTDDSRYACVTNSIGDSVTIIDIYTLSVVGEIPVGKNPHGLGYSNLSQFMYVANENDGTVSVVDIWSKKVINTIAVGDGVRTVKFGPDPRYGFAPNKIDNTCSMIDVTKDTIYDTIKTGKGPEDVTFSPDWVFIRNTGSADITAVSLRNMDLLKNIPIGYKTADEVELPMGHVSLVPSGDGHSVLVPSPAGKAVYRYAPGEATAGGTVPSEIFNTQANGSSTLVVYYRGLKEISSGTYLRVVRFQRPGRYEIGFYIDNPELTACFELYVTN